MLRCIRSELHRHSFLPHIHSTSHLQSKRYNSSQNPFLYISDFKNLIQKVEQEGTASSDDLIINALQACRTIQTENYAPNELLKNNSKSITETKQVVDLLFSDPNTKFNEDLLRQIFLLKLPTITNLQIINYYYQINSAKTTIIPKDVALIAFRSSLLNGDFKQAIKLTDVTVGHPNYILRNHEILKHGMFRLVGSAAAVTLMTKFGVNEIVDMGGLSDGWKHLGSINSMLLTYIINSSFFISIVRLGRQSISAGGDFVTWQKGTFYNNWFKHADEMMFASKIIEADRQLNGGESNPEITGELCRVNEDLYTDQHTLQPGYNRDGEKIRLLQTKDDLEDLKLQAYWMSGGDGFEWVEPDQDPAELLWKDYLGKFDKPLLNNAGNGRGLKWADELIEEEK